MKRTKLIEYTLIVVGAFIGYKFIEEVFALILQIVTELTVDGYKFTDGLMPILFSAGLYFFLLFIIIRKSKQIALYLNGNNAEETVPVKIGKQVTMQLVLIGLSANTILNNLPGVLIYLYGRLKAASNPGNDYDTSLRDFEKEEFMADAVRLTLAVITIVLSREIVKWFLKNDGKDELVLEGDNKEDTPNS